MRPRLEVLVAGRLGLRDGRTLQRSLDVGRLDGIALLDVADTLGGAHVRLGRTDTMAVEYAHGLYQPRVVLDQAHAALV